MEFLRLSKDTLVDWSLLPQVELVSNSEDNMEVATAKVRVWRWREEEAKRQEEEAKAERRRQKEAEEVWKAEEARRQEENREAEGDRRGAEADGVRAAGRDAGVGAGHYGHARQWNAGTIVSDSGADAEGMREVHGPPAGAQGKARKACVWPLGAGGAGAAMGSGTKVSGKPALRRVRKRAERTVTNTSPRGGENCKKACMTTEEGEDDNNTEVFGVPRVMAEEQRNALGMLTQALVQVAKRMAVVEAHDEERLALEREMVEIRRAHLTMVRRAADQDLWKMGMLMQSPFVYLSKGKERAVETEVEAEEGGEEADDEDEDAQGEEE
ncbi:hypothetical protein SCLCIDRAFT_31507 [Scleroderma citrinum Foug A]|uniref:Uncharacterized protein n=1 Tax=Scleroderma citrinum Foug A TaxID=1036808 RepID=A0A0C3DCR3_9AGAM|nr:hypothetical protein SCLCIDRAFT_31507 [Scleroderma citrinum Foug A]